MVGHRIRIYFKAGEYHAALAGINQTMERLHLDSNVCGNRRVRGTGVLYDYELDFEGSENDEVRKLVDYISGLRGCRADIVHLK